MHTNDLIHETSPYLLQHAHNPVNWKAWNDSTLALAKSSNKLMIVSIGYAACHWCHVMEHESFEDKEVASLMNDFFISVKIDREERPDIDAIYMNACQLITGQGGWPLNAIVLPDGRPIYAGTYFPKQNWMKLLSYYQSAYEQERTALEQQASQIVQGIQQHGLVPFKKEISNINEQELLLAQAQFLSQHDEHYGGRKGAPKFPMPANYQFLLQRHAHDEDPALLTALTTTLDNMAMGGIYDQIGGGFARYSTDAEWLAPHFEKMLYDNGQLLSLYAHAFQHTQNDLYKHAVYQTIEWLEREMTSAEGGFYASLDADSEGEEGKFYVWSSKEFEATLGEDASWAKTYFDVTPSGNWEHTNILRKRLFDDKFAQQQSWANTDFENKKSEIIAQLLAQRSTRVRPATDDKILTSWNALTISGLIDAYNAFGEPRFLELAIQNANFLSQTALKDDYCIYRNYKNGRSTINGFLDDYAFLAQAFIDLYSTTLDQQWLTRASGIAQYALQHFSDSTTHLFYYNSHLDPELVARQHETDDNVIPSSNSAMAHVLLDLSVLENKPAYAKRAQSMLNNMVPRCIENPHFYANWNRLYHRLSIPQFEVAVVGKNAVEVIHSLKKHYLPNVVWLGSTHKNSDIPLLKGKYVAGETLIYVCQDKTCQFPVSTVDGALNQLNKQ